MKLFPSTILATAAFGVASIGSIAYAACGGGGCCGQSEACGDSADQGCALVLNLVDEAVPVIDAELGNLLRAQVDEETMAAQVYRALGKSYALKPFEHIPLAEDAHAAAVRKILADTAFPASPADTLTDEKFVTLRDELIARGNTSELEALRVGAFIEERDIQDLRLVMAATKSASVLETLHWLEMGSHHHLNAFVRHLKMRGEPYTPQLLGQAEFDAIVTAD